MKAISGLVTVFLLLVPLLTISAQEQGDDKAELYAITVQVQRVYPHALGYKVVYNRTDLYPSEVYLPVRWFTDAAGRAELVYSRHPSVPYMTVFYKDGEVSHLRLFAHADLRHRTWGALPSGEDLRDEFAVDELLIRY